MKNIISKIVVAMLICMLPQIKAVASSHREAPLIALDPQADNTDLYVFRSPSDSSKVIIIANYIPFEHPAGGPNWYTFGQNIRYEIHIKNKTTTTGDDIVYRFTFTVANQDTSTFFNIRLGQQNNKATYTCQRSMDGGATFTTIKTNGIVPPLNIGPRSIESGVGLSASGGYESLVTAAITTASTGEKLFCGPIDDPFFVDLGGAFDVGGFRHIGRDGLAKFNCHTIALEIPIATLQKDGLPVTSAANILDPNFIIGVWASASRPAMTTLSTTGGSPTTSGAWVQVSRLGMPLTNEVVIPVGSKDSWNRANPYTHDLDYAANFKNPELGLYMDASLYGSAVPGLDSLRIQSASLGSFDFRNSRKGLWPLKGSSAVAGTALDDAAFGTILLPDSTSPRAVDLLPIFYTGVPNLPPYQLATGKGGNPLAAGKPFINNFLPTLCDMIRLNMAVPTTSRTDPQFSSLGLISAAVLGLTDATYNSTSALQWIPNMDGFPNGRRLEDDVTTIELQAVSGVVLAAIGLWYDDYSGTGSPVTPDLIRVLSFNAGVTHNDTTFKTGFPFVQLPWRGFNGAGYTGPLSYTYYNVLPAFTGGASQTLSVCVNSSAASINSLLAVIDSNTGQTITWSSFASPVHGTLSASYTTTSTGMVLMPSGLTYTPTMGYSGNDSFKVKVFDGTASAITTIYVNVGSVTAITGPTSVCAGSMITLSNPTSGGTWTSSNASIATVASDGVVTGITAGSVMISYTAGTGCSATMLVNVKAIPGAISGSSSVCVGATTTMTDATSGGVSWMSSSPSVATIGSISGVVTGISTGTTIITYSIVSGCYATKVVSVMPVPSAISGSSTVCVSGMTTFSSSDAGGTWSSSSTVVATVGSSSGVVTGIFAGSAYITYTLSGCRALHGITVNAAPSPIAGTTTVCMGSTTALTDATTGGTWSSDNNAIATVSSTGVVTGTGTGTVTISYATGSCSRSVVVTVTSGVASITGVTSLCIGNTSALADATTGGTWSSSSTAIASVSASGVVSGVGSGSATITYSISSSCRATAVVTVGAAVPAITGASVVNVGTTTTLSNTVSGGAWMSSNTSIATVDASTGVVTGVAAGSAIITYGISSGCYSTKTITVGTSGGSISGSLTVCAGNTSTLTDPTPGGASWSSGNMSVATVGATSGVVTGVAAGTAVITHTLTSGAYATATVTINPLPAVIMGTTSTCVGSATMLSSASTGGTWSSSNTLVATADASSGTITGVAAGSSYIYYTFMGCSRAVTLMVNPIPAVITGVTTVCTGSTSMLSSATTGGAWTSSMTSVATISGGGLVSGLTTGTSLISYTLSATGCARTTTVTVGSVSGITGTLSLCIGMGSTLADASTGGTWSSSNPAIATVNSAGLATGVAAGTATITYGLSAGCRATAIATVSALPSVITGTPSVCVNSTTALASATGGGTWSSSNPSLGSVSATGVVTGVSAGTPTISYILSTGCYRAVNVAVKALPAAIAGNASVCVGTSSTLTDPTSGGMSWASSNTAVATIGATSGVLSGVSVGTSVITFTLATGCTATKVATVNPGLSAGTITGPATVSLAASMSSPVMYTDGVSGGTWSTSNTARATIGAATGLLTGVSAGAVTVTYTVSNSCQSLSAIKAVTITSPRDAGNNLNDNQGMVQLFPNPNSGNFTLMSTVAGSLTVYTLEGKQVQQYQLAVGTNTLSLPKNIAAGVYMCRYAGDDGSIMMVRLVYEAN